MAFYDEMRTMAAELLLPDARGGLGQGTITVIRTTDDKPSDWPSWEPWSGEVTTRTYLLRGAVSGVAKEFVNGDTVLATDQVLICADYMELILTQVGENDPVGSSTVVPFDLEPGEVVNIDGRPLTTLPHTPIPGAGVKAAHRFILRG